MKNKTYSKEITIERFKALCFKPSSFPFDFEIDESCLLNNDLSIIQADFEAFLKEFSPKAVCILTKDIKRTTSLDMQKIQHGKDKDLYLYLAPNRYLGYIYKVTDISNGKIYIGQHISETFDETYYGSGSYIKRVIKQRLKRLKLELLEWCRQDISDRELYYIKKYNSLVPNGYNLTDRKQWFSFNKPERIAERTKAFYKTDQGKECIKAKKKILQNLYKTEQGRSIIKKTIQTRLKNRQLKLNQPDKPDTTILRRLFIEDNLSIDEIASLYKRSRSTIRRYLKEVGLTKSPKLARACQSRLAYQKAQLHPESTKKSQQF